MLRRIILLIFGIVMLSLASSPTMAALERVLVNCEMEGLEDCEKVIGHLYDYNIHGELDKEITIKLPVRLVEIGCLDKEDIAIGYYDEDNNKWVEKTSHIEKVSEGLYKLSAVLKHLGYVAVIQSSECVPINCTSGGYQMDPTTGYVDVDNAIRFEVCGLIPGCDATSAGTCDANCPQWMDPDCDQETCESIGDSCCLASKDGECDPDCFQFMDLDCCEEYGQYSEERAECYCYTSNYFVLKFPNGEVVLSDTLDIPFQFKAIGAGHYVLPSISVNDLTIYNRESAFTKTLEIGSNSVSMQSNNGHCDDCGCYCDGVFTSIATVDGEYILTKSSNQQQSYATRDCSGGYIETAVCGDCCMTSFATTIEVTQCANPKEVYLCDEEGFDVTLRGGGEEQSIGECIGKTWCTDEEASRDEAECEYVAEEGYKGINEFNVWFCDTYDCHKFVKGNFQVCGSGWDCTAICMPGECNYDLKEWCNSYGIWQKEEWCHNECGKTDSTCGGNCEHGVCDIAARKWCKDGYWVDDNYCDCDICGILDSSCNTGCPCEEGDCDTMNERRCEEGIWKSDSYCWTGCCQEDYDCYTLDICVRCVSGTCDTKNNMYCLGDAWISADYCELYCGKYDYDCGTDPCEDGLCDLTEKMYCKNGVWMYPGAAYCYPGYCGLQDASCDCSSGVDGCCKPVSDGICDHDCMQGADPDCPDCTPEEGDCCDDTPGNECDLDCIAGVDPDCQSDCDLGYDDCCSDMADENCDPDCTENSDIDCVGYCTEGKGDCCLPDNDLECDPDCIPGVDPNCAAYPCDENWICNEWNVECNGVSETHTCLEWEDTNDCNTFYDKPTDTQDCYKEFTCGEDDDKDGDGYPWRACYDAVNDVVLEELDCKGDGDDDPSRNPSVEEVCNGLDDNCDDSVDEGCPCVEGADPQQCGKSEGICKPGIQICEAGYWGVCGGPGYVGPQKEVCDDGEDNNCDSFIDENCNCIEGETQECGSDVGICKKGWQACYHGSFGSVCNEAVEGVTESCDNSVDDDCDSYTDGDDSNCQVTTPVTTGPDHCKNRKQDEDETGVDCGGEDCEACEEKPPACDYGRIVEKCVCGAAAYKTGYCCNGKYSLVACKEQQKDTDNDGCYDDNELQMGTDMRNGDTDGDGLLDCDPDEMYPLCNEDGTCDAENDYPETLENCPQDCGAGLGLLMWVLVVLVILALMGVGGYLYAKKKGYKLSDFIKIKGKKKEEKLKFQFGSPTKISPKIKALERTSQLSVKSGKRNIFKLRSFVRTSLKKGYTKLQIRQAALKEGWTKEQIDEALKEKRSKYKLFK